MKLLYLVSRFPYPLEKGDKLRAYHQITGLSKRFKIVLCCVTDKRVPDEWKKELEPYCESIYVFQLGKLRLYWNMLWSFFSTKPFQYHFFYQRTVQRQVDKIIEREMPKHIYCQLIRTAQYVARYTLIPKTLDYMDALSDGMRRRSLRGSVFTNWIYNLEALRLSKFETRLFDKFDVKTIISSRDRDNIDHPKRSDITIIPNGIDDRFFESRNSDKEYDVVFTGNMNYPPNVDAAQFLIRRIARHLSKSGQNTRILLSGANPSGKVLALKGPDVEVTGWVDDIRNSYAQSKLFVAPMFLGSGLQNKLLEAMAMGLPCITTPLANEALGASNGEHIIICEKAEDFASEISNLLSDPNRADSLAKQGRAFVKEHFQWEVTNNRLAKLIESSLR